MLQLASGRLYVGSHCPIEWNTLIDIEKKDSGMEEGYTGYVCPGWLEKH